jgi:hypothetical protein
MKWVRAMGKHTATPWQVHDNCGRKGEIGILADDAPCLIAIMANGGRGEWPIEAKANAEFIVRAVNAHDDLLAALTELVNCIEAEHHTVPGALNGLGEIGRNLHARDVEARKAARAAIALATGN